MRKYIQSIIGLLSIGLFATLSMTLVSCGGSSSSAGGGGFQGKTLYVANNGTTNVGTISAFSTAFASLGIFTSGANEGLIADSSGTVYQAGDNVSPGQIAAFMNFQVNFSMTPAPSILGGTGTTLTGLTAPKGIEVFGGLLVVADFGAGDLKVFATGDSGDMAPTAVVTLSAKPWDLDYDSRSDRLFVALTNGTVGVFDGFTTNLGAGGESRIITPSDSSGTKVSTNIHGIEYRASDDRLFLSDVGAPTSIVSATFNTDGAIFVISGASTASGAVSVETNIAGPATMLGNPVDLVLNGNTVLIAEKANDFIIGFSVLPGSPGGDLTPTVLVGSVKPESLLLLTGSPS